LCTLPITTSPPIIDKVTTRPSSSVVSAGGSVEVYSCVPSEAKTNKE